MTGSFISKTRYTLIVCGVIAAFCAVIARLSYLHVWEKERLGRIIERSRQKFDILEARRGAIVDARGNVLATTKSVIELGVDPQMLTPEDEAKWPQLAALIGLGLGQLKEYFAQKVIHTHGPDGEEIRPIRWKRLVEALDESIYAQVQKLSVRGVYGNRHYVRTYPGEQLAAHVLGFVNKEGKAAGGVEQFMDFYLRGQDGWRQSERDGKRQELAQFRTREVDPTHGLSVELTIDWHVQHILEKALARIVEKYQPASATIIVSEPVTGSILGLANVPTFSPAEFSKADFEAQRNRAITDVFEPGSTFKIVPISAALEENLVSLDQEFDCKLTHVEYRGRSVKLPKDHRPFDTLTMREVIAKSSNRGVAQLAMMMGAEKLYEYANAFGFGETTGCGLIGEVAGVLHPTKRWDGLTISRLPMGHAVSATPLQVHQAMACVANQGILTQPQFVRRIFDEKGNTVIAFEPHLRRRVIGANTAKTLAGVLVQTVSPQGTSARAQIPGYEAAGKSGTSQKIINGHYSNSRHVASFSGFFPASHPRLVVTIVVDDPKLKGVGYGSVVAAPVFKEVAHALIQHYGLQPVPPQHLALQGGSVKKYSKAY